MLKNKRRLYIFLLLLVVFTVVIFVNCNDDDSKAIQLTNQNNAVDNDKDSNGPQPIVGLDYAQNNQEIRNPFSITHETAAMANSEIIDIAPTEPMPANELPLNKVTSSVNKASDMPVKVNSKLHNEVHEVINLQGIMQGENGILAILQMGNTTVLASQGDRLNNWQLSEIGDNYVVLKQDQATKIVKLGKN